MMLRNKFIGVLALGFWIFPSAVSAEPGRTAVGILTRSFGARAAGMGEALAADSGELDSIAFNPAGSAYLQETALSATYQRGLADDNFGYLNWAYAASFGSIYAGASYLDGGPIELNLSDGTHDSRRAQQDTVGILGLSYGRNHSWALGLTGKFIRSELAETVSATGFATDAGAFWQTPLPFLSLGAAIQNLGSDIRYDEADDELPTTGRYGIRLLTDQRNNMKWWDVFKNQYGLHVDGVQTKNESASMNVGLEITHGADPDNLLESASLRAGYVGATKAPTVGVGFKARFISIDYGVNFVDSFDVAHRVTMTVHFSGPKPDEAVIPSKINLENVFSN